MQGTICYISIPTSLTSTICHVNDLTITQVSSWFVWIHESLLGSFVSASFFGFWIRMLTCSLGGNLATILEMLLKIWLNLQHQIWYCVWEYDDGVLAAILLQNWGDFLVWEELFHLWKSDCWNENLTNSMSGWGLSDSVAYTLWWVWSGPKGVGKGGRS